MDFNIHYNQNHQVHSHLGYLTPSPDSPKEVKVHNEICYHSSVDRQDSSKDDKAKQLNDDMERPSHSYIALISMACLSKPDKKILLNEIYDWVVSNFEYYHSRTDKSWRNSIRHNLSLNECFIKVGKAGNGRGYYWSIHPTNMSDFKKGDFRRRHSRMRARIERGSAKPVKIPPNESFLSSPHANLLIPSQSSSNANSIVSEQLNTNQTIYNNSTSPQPPPNAHSSMPPTYYYNNSQIPTMNEQFASNMDLIYHQPNLSSTSNHHHHHHPHHQYNYMTAANFHSWLPAAAAAAHNNFLESLTSAQFAYNSMLPTTPYTSNENDNLQMYHSCHSFNQK